ncbi:MAG: Rieske (2Fe-2S) protein, partial [Nevskiales bacterium]
MNRPRRLCALGELASPGSARFELEAQPHSNGICVIRQGERQGGRIYGYLNRCPHTGGPLDWVPGRFLSAEGDLIQCSTHGALFRIEDGFCVWGPCAGASLTPVPLKRQGDDIYL